MVSWVPRFLPAILLASAFLGCLGAAVEDPSADLEAILAPAWDVARDRDADAALAWVGAEGLGTGSLSWHADFLVRGEALRLTLRDGVVVAQKEGGPAAAPPILVDVASVRFGLLDAFGAARATPAHADLAVKLGPNASHTGTLVPLESGQYWTILSQSTSANVGTLFAIVNAGTGDVEDVGDIGKRDPVLPVFGERVVHAEGVLEGRIERNASELDLTLPRFPPGARVVVDACTFALESKGVAIVAHVAGASEQIGYENARKTFTNVEGPVSLSFLTGGSGPIDVKVGYHIDNGRSFERTHSCHG